MNRSVLLGGLSGKVAGREWLLRRMLRSDQEEFSGVMRMEDGHKFQEMDFSCLSALTFSLSSFGVHWQFIGAQLPLCSSS